MTTRGQKSKQANAGSTTLLMQDLSLEVMQDLSDGPAIPAATETMLQWESFRLCMAKTQYLICFLSTRLLLAFFFTSSSRIRTPFLMTSFNNLTPAHLTIKPRGRAPKEVFNYGVFSLACSEMKKIILDIIKSIMLEERR